MSYTYACVLWPEIVVHDGCGQKVWLGVTRGVMVGAREVSWWVWLKGSCSCIDNVRAYLLSEKMKDMMLDEASVDKYACLQLNE